MSTNNNTASDEAVSQFLAITGSVDANQATSYLEMANNDLQTAVDLFFQYSSAPTSNNNAASSSSSNPMQNYDDTVRAPDQTRSEQLIGGNLPSFAGLMDNPVFGPHAAAAAAAAASSGPIRNQSGMRAFANDDYDDPMLGSLRDVTNAAASSNTAVPSSNDDSGNGEVQDVTNMHTNRATKLSDMFAPPRHLIHSAGGFHGARNIAKDSRRWLLVNIQSDSNFASHALNRDVWRDELVENLVREGFIFWQSDDTLDDGRTYIQRYGVHSFPHIAIIDPRTARLMHRMEGWTQEDHPMTPEKFAELAADFCSRHSFDNAPTAPRTKGKNGSSSTVSKKNPNEMSEEEQIKAAIQASMMNDSNQDDNCDIDSDDENSYVMSDDDDDGGGYGASNDEQDAEVLDSSMDRGMQHDVAPQVEEPKKKEITFEEEIVAMEVGEEPKDKAARIMIRMPDGKRLVRKFGLDDTVKTIYAFVAQANDDAKGGKKFELKAGFPPKDLLPSVNESIVDVGLNGGNITVRWIDN